MKTNKDILERDLYAIEETPEGKAVHVMAYAYDAEDGTDKHYRLVEFVFMSFPVESDEPLCDRYASAYNASKQQISEYDAAGIEAAVENYFGEPFAELDYEEITPDTPRGCYIER